VCKRPVCPKRLLVRLVVATARARRKLVTVALDEHTVTVYDADTPIKAVPRRSTTNLNRTKAKHQITTTHRAQLRR
jgi:cyanophycinase-like exopeptidase